MLLPQSQTTLVHLCRTEQRPTLKDIWRKLPKFIIARLNPLTQLCTLVLHPCQDDPAHVTRRTYGHGHVSVFAKVTVKGHVPEYASDQANLTGDRRLL